MIIKIPNIIFFPIIFFYGFVTLALNLNLKFLKHNIDLISKNKNYGVIKKSFILIKTICYIYIGSIEIYTFHLRKNKVVTRYLIKNTKFCGINHLEDAMQKYGHVIFAPLHLVNTALWSILLSNLGYSNTLVTVSQIRQVIEEEMSFCNQYMGKSTVKVECVDEKKGSNIFALLKNTKTDKIINIAPDNNRGGNSKIKPYLFGCEFSGGIGVVLLSKLGEIPILTASITRRGLFKLFRYDACIYPAKHYASEKNKKTENLEKDINDYFNSVEKILDRNIDQWIILHTETLVEGTSNAADPKAT
ncbi:MAG: hypothetical protein CMP21_08690 [Rickettsiales bacterium]|nr:hypothetical protein [Rickettsiales bacterium]